MIVPGVGHLLMENGPKRPGRHPRSGRVHLGALVVVAVTASGIAAARPRTSYLLILGALAVAAAGVGLSARRMRWHGWRHHIAAMAISYITLLTAFYVDDGPRLPLWKPLPPITFWFLPAGVGLPLLLRALHRFPSSSRPDSTFREETAP
ncbi:hypothetical protein BJY14_000715 [Actinomadura luteofluorescens]|uniref:DUF2306 domain-containing protein n=2 Tax=Actinomadura luteofluorescens TaxID=46163 RepID=A0A7Y9EBW6_9ACTN|nr:DUF2306 domain-containing protein [Actinomadura luteofluorescens]NYD44732.1 hypothetical protein [Actinomadura luteofluorescens]